MINLEEQIESEESKEAEKILMDYTCAEKWEDLGELEFSAHEVHGILMDSLKRNNNDINRLEECLVRIAKVHGLESPLELIMMAENDEENYAEILARYIENKMSSN